VPRHVFALGALLYALFVTYGSTLIGPQGPNFVPMPWPEAGQAFLERALVWAPTGSDQRADWMGNLLMLVPLGCLVAGTLWPAAAGRHGARPLPAAIVALALCVLFVLAVKFAQLFFPPRTVTLNYVTAQTIGATIGVLLFWLGWERLATLGRGMAAHPRESLAALLRLYTAGLLLFMLLPLDFALSGQDIAAQLDRLGEVLTNLPGADRPPLVQAALLLAGTVALVPVGMALALGGGDGHARRGRPAAPGVGIELRRSVARATFLGFLMMLAVLGLTTMLMSGAPSLVTLVYRTAGIAAGAALMHWLTRQDPMAIRHRLAATVPWLVLPYLLLLLGVKELLSWDWQTPAEALDSVNQLGLMPFFYWYIVSKAEAAKNIVAHAAMYAPIGAMVWLRHGRPSSAFLLALLLGLLVETARFLRPEMQGDVNAVLVGAVSAWLVAWLMPVAWWLLGCVARPMAAAPVSAPAQVGWRARAAAASRRGPEPLSRSAGGRVGSR
jgi:VanZ family protein